MARGKHRGPREHAQLRLAATRLSGMVFRSIEPSLPSGCHPWPIAPLKLKKVAARRRAVPTKGYQWPSQLRREAFGKNDTFRTAAVKGGALERRASGLECPVVDPAVNRLMTIPA
jgi:hypothetical protein